MEQLKQIEHTIDLSTNHILDQIGSRFDFLDGYRDQLPTKPAKPVPNITYKEDVITTEQKKNKVIDMALFNWDIDNNACLTCNLFKKCFLINWKKVLTKALELNFTGLSFRVLGCRKHPDQVKFPGHSTQVEITDTVDSGGVGGFNADYNTIHNALTGTIDHNFIPGANYEHPTLARYYVYRGLILFDTSVIPLGSTVLSAYFNFYCVWNYDNDNDSLIIVDGSPIYPTDPIAAGDYNKNNWSGNYGQKDFTEIVQGQWFNLNFSDVSKIVVGSLTKHGLRSQKDIDADSPPDNTYNMLDAAGPTHASGNDPKMNITYEESKSSNKSNSFLPKLISGNAGGF